MFLFNFIKSIILDIRVKCIFNPFFNGQVKKENTSKYIDPLPEKIKDIYTVIKDLKKYRNSCKLYEEYFDYIEKHNKLLDDIYSKVNNFSYNQIKENPLIFDCETLIKINDEVYQKLLSMRIFDKKLNEFIIEYNEFKENYKIIIEQFENINLLNSISNLDDKYYDKEDLKRLKLSVTTIKEFFHNQNKKYYNPIYPDLNKIIEEHNEKFINEHINDSIFDNINDKSLDLEQRRSILTNPKSNLTIAGAGSGKTLTICGKVKYLLEVLKIPKENILLLSYSKASAEDLKSKVEKIDKGLNVHTFHALGLDILNKDVGKKFTVDDSFNAVIESYFRDYMKNNPHIMSKVLNYYGLYLLEYNNEERYEDKGKLYESLKKNDFRTLKNQLQECNEFNNKIVTIKKENVKSFEELAIANYLFINGVDYVYEATYKEENTATSKKRQYTPDFYLPEYNIYYEHYGIDENGRATQYKEDEELDYIRTKNWKQELHKRNNTICIETYSYEFKFGTIFTNLEKRLKEQGVKFKPLSEEGIDNAIKSIYEGQSFKSFITLIRTFISLYKARYENEYAFYELKNSSFSNTYEKQRADMFIDICIDIYRYYKDYLKKEDKIDFDDMILKSIDAISRTNEYKYQYIIVDEFQDISYSRKNFLKCLIEHGNSKLYAVGDDWQAIYRYAGCDINIFLNFKEYFEDSKYCFITSTHRNSQELQNIAEPFITKNPEQFKKDVKSDKHLAYPIRVMYYDDNKYQSFIKILADINSLDENANILLLGRNNKDIEFIESNEFYRESRLSNKYISTEFPNLNIRFITAHSSKGLEEDYVIIINADDYKLGFPNKIEDDSLLDLVLSRRENFKYAEERRLWYVALTRTRSYTYILASAKNQSEFVKEISKDCFIMNPLSIRVEANPILCPNCKSGRLVIRENSMEHKKFYGCSNYPYCKYTNNDIKSVNSNHKCPLCGNFMVVKKGSYGYFWGCSNYPDCKYKEKYEYTGKTN